MLFLKFFKIIFKNNFLKYEQKLNNPMSVDPYTNGKSFLVTLYLD